MMDNKLADRYQLLEKIGEGGMALVFKARDLRTGHDVAVKFLKPEYHGNPDFVAFFQREATAASKMSHHNIVNLLDVGDDEKGLYIVIEYVNGKTLKDIIKERGRMSEEVAAQIVIRILSALQHAHSAHIIHRDIKPQNILVDQNGYIKVSDFGIARMMDAPGEMWEERRDTVMGSVHYFSPEQARGETATTASDLYSVGVVFYEMLTGKVPFEGDKAEDIATKHIKDAPRPVREMNPDVSPAIEKVVMKALEKTPQSRYRTATDMAQAIKSALLYQEKEITRDTPVIVPQRIGRDVRQRKRRKLYRTLATVGTALMVLAALVFGSLMIYNRVVTTTKAPYCIGETEEEARRLLTKAWLKTEVVRQESQMEAGTVVLQSHDYGFRMKKGDTVLLTVSTGPKEKTVPSVEGLPEEEARRLVEKVGLQLSRRDIRMDVSAPGTVLMQEPVQGTVLEAGGIVQVDISGGRVTMPNLVGKTREEVFTELLKLDIRQDKIKITEIPVSDSTQFERVADQLPEEGRVVMPLDKSLEIVLAVYVKEAARP